MKPAIIVKTKGGKRYLQIKTVDGDLIHIGSASVLKNWQVAKAALKMAYESLIFCEKHELYPVVIAEKLDLLEALEKNIDKNSEEWKGYLEKLNNKHEEREKRIDEYEKKHGVKIARGPWKARWFSMAKNNQDPTVQRAAQHCLKTCE